MKPYGIVYKITNRINGKVYIGQTTVPLSQRFAIHCHPSSGCIKLRNAIQKYGRNVFTCDAIYSSFDAVDLDNKEVLFIEQHRSHVDGYNLLRASCRGGTGSLNPFFGKKHTETTKHKIRTARALQVIVRSAEFGFNAGQRLRMYNIGTHRSPSTEFQPGQRASVRTEFQPGQVPHNKGIVLTTDERRACSNRSPSKKSIASFDGYGRMVQHYASIREAARQVGLDRSHIGRCCKDSRKQAGGYRWSYYPK